MTSLKLTFALQTRHGGKFVPLFPGSTFRSPFTTGTGDYRGSFIQTLALMDPCILSCTNSLAKGSQLFTTRASAQPLTEELVDNKPLNLSNSGDSIRTRFLEFYAAKGHKVLPSSSLVPEDPSN